MIVRFQYLLPAKGEKMFGKGPKKSKSIDPEQVIKNSGLVLITGLISLFILIACVAVYYLWANEWSQDYQKMLALFIFLSGSLFVISGLVVFTNMGTLYVHFVLKSVSKDVYPPKLGEAVRQYANVLSKHGIDSSEALAVREEFSGVSQFLQYANALDQLKAALKGTT